jgi:hypothetical protein
VESWKQTDISSRAFNNSDTHLGSQAVVLNALNVVNYRYWSGRRTAPAFSQATAADLEQDATWVGINDDLEKEGVDPSAIANEKPFIKKWIDDVILADTGHQDETAADDESIYSQQPPTTFERDEDRQSSFTDSFHNPPWNPRPPARIETDRTLVEKSPTFQHAKLTPTRTRDTRSSMSSQGCRKSSDQTPRNQQIHANLDSLFRMNSGASKELVDGLIQHVFAQLDKAKRGVFPDRLEAALMPVVVSTMPTVKQKALEIIEAETVPGTRMDQATFASILLEILESANAAEKSLEDVKTTDSIGRDRDLLNLVNKIAYHWLLSNVKNDNVKSLLPYGWEFEDVGIRTKFFHYVPHNVTCHKTVLPRLPISIVRTFANMLLLSRHCRAELDKLQELWESHDELDEHYLRSSLELVEDVREAAQTFEVFGSRKTAASTSKLDDILGQAEVVDLADAALVGQIGTIPAQELRDLQQHAFQSLQAIIVFLIDLSDEDSQSTLQEFGEQQIQRSALSCPEIRYSAKPPPPGQSHSKMQTQASRILTDAKKWYDTSNITIKACRTFAATYPQLSDRAREALSGSKRLYLQSKRCKHLMVPGPTSLVADKFMILRLEHVEDFPKGNKIFRAGPPDIEALIYIDNIRLSKSRRAAIREQNPATGRDIYRWNTAEPYHISTDEQGKLYIHIYNAKRRDRGDEGFMGLVVIDVSTLPTGMDAEPITVPLSSFAKTGVQVGKLTMRVHWCPLVQFVRGQQTGFAATWARKDTADDRFYFEDLKRHDGMAGARTAVFERWSEGDGVKE